MLISDTKSQTQETQRTPSRINTKKPVPGYIVLKQQKIKDKEEILKEARTKKKKKIFIYKGAKIRIISSFSSETKQARREQIEIFKVLRAIYFFSYISSNLAD